MKKIYLPKKQKGVFAIPGIIVIAALIGIITLVILLGQRQPKSYTVPIDPSQLMPLVSAQEARTTICNLEKEGLFSQACQSKFDAVGKEDVERISELFNLLNTIQNDKSISDYDRLLLAQTIFAALPIGDNPENSESFNINQQSLLSRLRDYLIDQITVYAQEQAMSEEEFKKQMERDLKNVVDSLPKGDNAWVVNMMVSKYSWIDGKPRPLYSHQYMESFDPFPNNPNVNTRDINYNIRSVVGSKASDQTVDVGGPSYKGTSDTMAYSFTIMSWNSKEYTGKEELVGEQFLVRRRNRSDSFYQGEHYLASLLDAVKLPSTKRLEPEPTEVSTSTEESAPAAESASNSQTGELEKISCEELKEWVTTGKDEKCPAQLIPADKPFIWCAEESFGDLSLDEYMAANPPKYAYDFDYTECINSLK